MRLDLAGRQLAHEPRLLKVVRDGLPLELPEREGDARARIVELPKLQGAGLVPVGVAKGVRVEDELGPRHVGLREGGLERLHLLVGEARVEADHDAVGVFIAPVLHKPVALEVARHALAVRAERARHAAAIGRVDLQLRELRHRLVDRVLVDRRRPCLPSPPPLQASRAAAASSLQGDGSGLCSPPRAVFGTSASPI